MRIYLDNCCYNRPFDDQTQLKIYLEAQAKLLIQAQIMKGEHDLVWSYVLDYELRKNPYEDKKEAIAPWKKIARVFVGDVNDNILSLAARLKEEGLKTYDASHIACAVDAGCDFFLTTDRQLLRRSVDGIRIVNPIQFISEMEETAK